MQSLEQAQAYIATLTGNVDAICDFRMIHDTNKGIPAIPMRGTLAQCWQSIVGYNNQGYGSFICINAMDGNGLEYANVQYIRTHVVDLDNVSAGANYDRATQWFPAPSFAVQSSPGKYHVYWPVAPYLDNDAYVRRQRKLRQFFDGDKTVIDPTRVLRLPGTYHLKNPQTPHLITCWSLGGYGYVTSAEQLDAALQMVNVYDDHSGGRAELGHADHQAPHIDWLDYTLKCVDPNELERGEWISLTAAIKQAFWNLADEQTIFAKWSAWCEQYTDNDPAENQKQWNSIRNTEIGWKNIVNRVPSVKAQTYFQSQQKTYRNNVEPEAPTTPETLPPVNQQQTAPTLPTSDILTEQEQAEWFKGCVAITRTGDILTPQGRFLSPGQFNMAYGGKHFIITSTGKTTDEAWKAATRSTLWTVPKVDHTRFLPDLAFGQIVEDALGRSGVNTFIPIRRKMREGDPTPFLRHLELMFPDPNDRAHLLAYFAHAVKFPGFKIPWAPLIQSTEGVGKGVLKQIIQDVIGEMYFYSPSASELVASGSKFNGWMRGRLFILVDEIRVDEKRDMIEVLKPMITEKRLEVQSKGIDQEMEDNFTNWAFFSNYKDAIPTGKNSRRFGIFYSVIQSYADLMERGMDDAYFNWLFAWLENGGSEIVTWYLTNYPIEYGQISMRAPTTTSTLEAQYQSRTPLEDLITNAVEDNAPGFCNGWVSVSAVMARVKGSPIRNIPTVRTIGNVLETMGYHSIGRAPRVWRNENLGSVNPDGERSMLYHRQRDANGWNYGLDQGYGE